jgi:hypothetical protein
MSEVNVQEHIGQAVNQPLPRLQSLPAMLPLEGAVRIELEEGVPVFRTSDVIRDRIEDLVAKQRRGGLSSAEEEELDRYEEIDDYLSFVNRVMRNVIQAR